MATGERNERIEQLEEDISDMKHIFHQQLEVCVDQLNAAQEQLAKATKVAAAAAADLVDPVVGVEGEAKATSHMPPVIPAAQKKK